MTAEEQFEESFNIQQLNSIENENDNEISTNTPTTARVRRSRFFRTKRKQRLLQEQSNLVNNNNAVIIESMNSSKSSEQSIEELSVEDVTAEELSVIDTETLIDPTVNKRPLVSPPPLLSTDDLDEIDANSTSEENQMSISSEDLDTGCHSYITIKQDDEKQAFAQARLFLSKIYSGYSRQKSQSVKLMRIDPIDAYPKKNVRFADDFGLDLSQVKMIKSDELPQVPSAAFKDLKISDNDNSNSFFAQRMKTIIHLEQRFKNPLLAENFADRVSTDKVALEQANAIDNRIYGTIKIVSFDVNKRVKIRSTTDNWSTYLDNEATYIVDSFDGTHDRFSFTLEINRDRICIGNNIQFCICYESLDALEYWDNNYHENYQFDCVSRTIPDYST